MTFNCRYSKNWFIKAPQQTFLPQWTIYVIIALKLEVLWLLATLLTEIWVASCLYTVSDPLYHNTSQLLYWIVKLRLTLKCNHLPFRIWPSCWWRQFKVTKGFKYFLAQIQEIHISDHHSWANQQLTCSFI